MSALILQLMQYLIKESTLNSLQAHKNRNLINQEILEEKLQLVQRILKILILHCTGSNWIL